MEYRHRLKVVPIPGPGNSQMPSTPSFPHPSAEGVGSHLRQRAHNRSARRSPSPLGTAAFRLAGSFIGDGSALISWLLGPIHAALRESGRELFSALHASGAQTARLAALLFSSPDGVAAGAPRSPHSVLASREVSHEERAVLVPGDLRRTLDPRLRRRPTRGPRAHFFRPGLAGGQAIPFLAAGRVEKGPRGRLFLPICLHRRLRS